MRQCIIMTKVKQVAFDISQGQGILLSQRFHRMQSFFISKGFLMSSLTNRLDLEDLDKYDLLILLVTSSVKYRPMEIQSVISYVNRGGNILLMVGDLEKQEDVVHLNNLLKPFQIELKHKIIFDPSKNYNKDPSTILVMPTESIPNPKRIQYIPMNNAIAIQTQPQQALLVTSPSASGGMQTAVARSSVAQTGRIIVVGSLSVFDDSPIGLKNESNYQIFKQYVDWLVGLYDPIKGQDNQTMPQKLEIQFVPPETKSDEEIINVASQKLIEDFMKDVDVEEISSQISMDNFDVEDLTVRILRAFLANALRETKELEAQHGKPVLTIEGLDQVMLMLYNINKTLERIAGKLEDD